jgi:hypothetical protein
MTSVTPPLPCSWRFGGRYRRVLRAYAVLVIDETQTETQDNGLLSDQVETIPIEG